MDLLKMISNIKELDRFDFYHVHEYTKCKLFEAMNHMNVTNCKILLLSPDLNYK